MHSLLKKLWKKLFKRIIYNKKSLEIPAKNPKITIIFLHGIAADSSTWEKTFKKLKKFSKENNIRAIALDLLGHGLSKKYKNFRYNYSETDLALENSIKKYKIKTPIIIVGHSMGCLIAAHFAKTHKNLVKNLILISPPIIKKSEISTINDRIHEKTYRNLEKISGRSGIQILATIAEKLTSFRKKYLNTDIFNNYMNNIILNEKNFDFFASLETQTMIIHGRLDPLVIGKNLREVTKLNNLNLDFIPVLSSHDISKQKYDKMILCISKTLEHINSKNSNL